jgi:uncharacterized protein
VIVPDVNVLVRAFKRESHHHDAYADWLHGVLVGAEDVGLVEPVLTGLVRLATHPRVFANPAPTGVALAFVEALRQAPASRHLPATDASWDRLGALAAVDVGVRGNLVPDAHLAAVALTHGGRVATADRGFARFEGLRWFDPLEVA